MAPLFPSVSPPPADADLVARVRRGDRDGFELVVERYQSLVCALAYSACGNAAQSEDIAQEVFISAWRQIQELREPNRLREWLCGIARRSAVQAYRHDRREPAQMGAVLSGEEVASEPPPCEQAMRREEELLLWRALARLPESYREVLVLYYREHQSIEHVA
jgi:RNA polymerase sigma factor (sigma-70 family)